MMSWLASLADSQVPDTASIPVQVHSASAAGDTHGSRDFSITNESATSMVLTKDGKRYLVDLAGGTVRELPGQSPPTGEAGSLFAKNCATCHGPDGKGKKSIGTPDFTDPAFQAGVSTSDMEAVIRKGKGVMPAWSGKLSSQQISDLINYVRSLSAAPPSVPPSNVAGGSAVKRPGQVAANKPRIYEPGDDVLFSLPTGRPTDRHGVYVNFSHRFPFQPAFTSPNAGATLLGLDNFAISSLGVRYGVTDKLSVGIYRSPSAINRPIQFMAGYNLIEEGEGSPLNLMVRVSIEGQNNFSKNFTENIEGILSRSLSSRAQFYIVPTVSFNDRRVIQPINFDSSSISAEPGFTAFSLGTGLAFDIRPTVALLAEVIPTLTNARELDIQRPVFSFGIQKKIWRHAFTFGLTTGPGTTVSQRAAPNSSFLNDPHAGTIENIFLGFDLTRQIR
jgi:cytochrome c553